MSECTKGEMKAGKINCGQFPISINGRHFAIIKFTHLIDMKQDEANAKEIVRRWNAFEDGGLVDELRTALEEVQKVFGFIAENYKSAPHFPAAERMLKAALAKS